MRNSDSTQRATLHGYPRAGLAILPGGLQRVLPALIRHSPLIDGSCATPAYELDVKAWSRWPEDDCRTIATAIARRLTFNATRGKRARQILAALRFPRVENVASMLGLPLSPALQGSLRRHDLLDPYKLADLSMLDVFELRGFGARRFLELVALFESLGLLPSDHEALPVVARARTLALPTSEDVQLLQKLEAALGTAEILANDVRFGDDIGSLRTQAPSLKRAIAILKGGAVQRGDVDPWPAFRTVLRRIESTFLALKTGSLEDDLRSILQRIARKDRKVRVLGLRLGWTDGQVRTLQAVGDIDGVTRERIRQIEFRAQKVLAGRSVYAPRLEEALEVARRCAPCYGQQLAEALRAQGLTTQAWPPSTLISAAVFLGIPHGLHVRSLGADEYMASAATNSDIPDQVFSVARSIARSEGAACLKDIAFRLSEEHGRWISLRDVQAVVKASPEVQWLDEEKGWLWFGEQAQNRVLNHVRKILCVARRISIDELYEGLIRSYRMDDEPVCPKPIVLALCRQVSWIRVRQRSHLLATLPLPYQDVLVGAERTMATVLAEAGGALDHHSFRMVCLKRGVPTATFGVYEVNSPILRRIRPSIWGLRGVNPSPKLILGLAKKVARRRAELARRTQERLGTLYPAGSYIGATAYRKFFGITAATLKNHVMTMAKTSGVPVGTRFQVVLRTQVLGNVELCENGRLKGLLPLLRHHGARVGQVYAADFDFERKLLKLERQPPLEAGVPGVEEIPKQAIGD